MAHPCRSNGRWLWRRVFTATSVDLYQTNNYIRRNHSIPNHPTARGTQDVVAATGQASVPAVLMGVYRAPARALIRACPQEQRQAVLDEVAALHHRSAIRGGPIGLLHRLVERENQGNFTPSHGIRYREQRRKESPNNSH